ncbi:transcription factor MYB124 [Magnolia sinica]|uniref:transcription factor MYB124 n=1 Tax=Magnolia sinica TaxID=86752 RepID=UPI002659DE28|nr:transcription factor MYB124 [Magnolia sinica]
MHAMKPNDAPKSETSKPRDRHIVTWTPQEDDMLREQITIHGTESWTAIAAQFKDKTGRQCRRRWYTYLNSDCKKGGWTPEEDMILCEAQKIFGNRWTEIAKVVSGRTDNAVKNRFSTLCKKRAKREALSKENNNAYITPNNNMVVFQDGCIAARMSESIEPLKKIRTHISDFTENYNMKEGLFGGCGTEKQQLRPPLAVLVQNFNNAGNLPMQHHATNNDPACSDVLNKKVQGTFLRRDDPKISALIQQAELLSSLAVKVNTENTNQSIENAWKELQDFLLRTEENEMLRSKIAGMDFLLEDFKDLVEELKSGNMGNTLSWRQPDLCEDSQGSSEYSTESTHQLLASDNKKDGHQAKECSLNHNTNTEMHMNHREVEIGSGCDDGLCASKSADQVAVLPSFDEPKDGDGIMSALMNTEFSSPVQMIPPFQTFAEGIPSPKFSESERHFLLRTLGVASPNTNTNPSCRRALLQSL